MSATDPEGGRPELDDAAVAETFAAAFELPERERRRFLDRACAGRAAMRAEVEALLAAHAAAAGFLSGAAVEPAAPPPDPPPAGGRAGPYRILTELGRGGMGAVYLAERADGAFDQQVALKLIKRGMDSEAILDRFLRERRILARLEHPNIARLLDGGITDDGRPYFAMEVVRGAPITLHCDARRLPIAARVELFLQACGAVQHAHGQLVVHRDLKPSNMLVAEPAGNTAAAEPALKLLDFGVAKLLDDEEEATALTRAGLRPLTPEYAAPEQWRAERATTAVDVYALGVVLYELLGGVRPPARAPGSGAEPERLAAAASRPSAAATRIAAERSTTTERLRRDLGGDLEAIVARALEAEPDHRYASVEALAADLRRWRDGLPVTARPATAATRLRKFVRRHRAGVATGVVVAASLLAGTAVSLWQATVATRERDRAERKSAEAQAVADFSVGLFRGADPEQEASAETTVRELLDRGARRLESDLLAQPLVRARLLETVADVYLQLRQLEPARRSFEQAISLREATQGADDAELLTALTGLATTQLRATEYDRSEATLRRALRIAEAGPEPRPREVARCLALLASLDLLRGATADAERKLRRLVALEEGFGESAELARTLNNLGVAVAEQERWDEAETIHARAFELRRRLLPAGHPALGQSLTNLARVDLARERWPEAERRLAEARAAFERSYGRRHLSVAETLALAAPAQERRGAADEAEAGWREALAIRTELLGEVHPETGAARLELALLLARRGRRGEALALAEQALAVLDAAPAATPADRARARDAVADLRAGS